MNRGPAKGQKPDFVARATDCWGSPPDWVVALAERCNAASQAVVGGMIGGYSASTVSQCISNTYKGDIERIADMVRGAFLQSVVVCPVLGEIGRDRCLQEQDEPFRATSAMRAQLYHHCRGACPHSKHHVRETDNGQG